MRDRPSLTRSAALLAAVLAGCGGAPPQPTGPTQHARPPDSRLPDDGFQIQGTYSGSLEASQITAVIEENMAGFTNCFKQAPGSYVAGKLQVEFIVKPSGRVEQVSILTSDLGSLKVEDCVLQASKFMDFPPPAGSAKTKFAFPFEWNLPGQRLSVPMEIAWGYGTMRAARKGLRACRADHGFQGPFHVTLYVGRGGQVLSAGFDSEAHPGTSFPACAVRWIGNLRFPDPGPRTVKYRSRIDSFPDA